MFYSFVFEQQLEHFSIAEEWAVDAVVAADNSSGSGNDLASRFIVHAPPHFSSSLGEARSAAAANASASKEREKKGKNTLSGLIYI